MAGRSIETAITFKHPFWLTSIEGHLPPGRYRLVTDEEDISGPSFLAFRQTATRLHLPALPIRGRATQVIGVDPAELKATLEADLHLG
jgi:hypothetical protein